MQPNAVVIGNFDGVHRGHQAVIQAAIQPGFRVVVLTFWPHPLQVLTPDTAPKLISDLPDRINLLCEAGADEVRVVEFDNEVASWTPEEFITRTIAPLEPKKVVVGQNFRFGKGARGDVASLQQACTGMCDVAGLELVGSDGEVISSTRIRAALSEGRLEDASQQLGRNFHYSGIVIMGDQRGRELGFPTANLAVPPERLVPGDGVYAGWLTTLADNVVRPAAISVGSNPTFAGRQTRVESFVLDAPDLQLYGSEISVEFVSRIRGQVKFAGIDALVEQMHQDVVDVRERLGI